MGTHIAAVKFDVSYSVRLRSRDRTRSRAITCAISWKRCIDLLDVISSAGAPAYRTGIVIATMVPTSLVRMSTSPPT